MHLTADGGTEDAIILITKLFHGEPRGIRIDIVDSSNVGNRAARSWDQLEPWRRTISAHIFDDLDRRDQQKNAGANQPFVGPNGRDGGMGLEEKSVGGLIGIEVVRDLGHDDRRRDGRRHDYCRVCIQRASDNGPEDDTVRLTKDNGDVVDYSINEHGA